MFEKRKIPDDFAVMCINCAWQGKMKADKFTCVYCGKEIDAKKQLDEFEKAHQ
ncbi:MAG: hypothetical protein Q7K42_00420 [Candidatus Diapherotrites archaeon]|nr:hypothetical protein [Candidatus Diapherotrites archaeon]